jgi:hypothetical protein
MNEMSVYFRKVSLIPWTGEGMERFGGKSEAKTLVTLSLYKKWRIVSAEKQVG